jgi:hypothetical protein
MGRTNKSPKISKEEAALALKRVLEQYRLSPTALSGVTPANMPSMASPQTRQTEPAKPLETQINLTSEPFIGDWTNWPGISAGSPEPVVRSQHELAQLSREEVREFYFVIRLAECALPILCQVTADSPAAARQQVELIRNLTSCQSISDEEFAEIEKAFFDGS